MKWMRSQNPHPVSPKTRVKGGGCPYDGSLQLIPINTPYNYWDLFWRARVNWAWQVAEGSSKALAVRSDSVASKKSPRLTRLGRPVKRALPSELVLTSRSSLRTLANP